MNPFSQNPQSVAIKKYFFEMLGHRYSRSERYIERLAASTITKEDYESLGTLMADLYESGFLRAVDQYKDQMSKMGMRVDIVPESKPRQGKQIFPAG